MIREGQVVSIDAGAIVDGWHGDAARTFVVGDAPPAVRDLVEATRLALEAGIAAARPGNRIWDISAAVEDVALPHGYGIVRPYVGHGIGTAMHEEPQVPNYRTKTRGIELAPGICLAIEPMFTLGSAEVETLADGWTVVTRRRVDRGPLGGLDRRHRGRAGGPDPAVSDRVPRLPDRAEVGTLRVRAPGFGRRMIM